MLEHSLRTRGSYLRSSLHLIKNTLSATPKLILIIYGHNKMKNNYIFHYNNKKYSVGWLHYYKFLFSQIQVIFCHHLPVKTGSVLGNNDNYRDMLCLYRSCFAASGRSVISPKCDWGTKNEATAKNITHKCIKRLKVIFTVHIITRWRHTIMSAVGHSRALHSWDV